MKVSLLEAYALQFVTVQEVTHLRPSSHWLTDLKTPDVLTVVSTQPADYRMDC